MAKTWNRRNRRPEAKQPKLRNTICCIDSDARLSMSNPRACVLPYQAICKVLSPGFAASSMNTRCWGDWAKSESAQRDAHVTPAYQVFLPLRFGWDVGIAVKSVWFVRLPLKWYYEGLGPEVGRLGPGGVYKMEGAGVGFFISPIDFPPFAFLSTLLFYSQIIHSLLYLDIPRLYYPPPVAAHDELKVHCLRSALAHLPRPSPLQTSSSGFRLVSPPHRFCTCSLLSIPFGAPRASTRLDEVPPSSARVAQGVYKSWQGGAIHLHHRPWPSETSRRRYDTKGVLIVLITSSKKDPAEFTTRSKD
ncbi:hypothetical protein DFP72DRAFT_839631 [Ephemerocybe angulata]|uniref:Uncharacterized protein n=1 Tax=Ephemerocybe angulata TaxID=980116 RepID=A0A8H6MDY6_9AGAR|nr:hypothetical protein DFP72DRAFT_839631 [Tulosesus angulatus]